MLNPIPMINFKSINFFELQFLIEKKNVFKFFLISFLAFFSFQSFSQVVRYATAQDVINIKNANLGDLLVTGGTEMSNGIPAIYIYGKDNWVIPPGKKILIKGGIYEWLVIENGSSGTAANPIVITNYDGQVETKEFKISGLKFFKLTGKYDLIKKTGDVNFSGHALGYAFSQNKYGIYVNNRWTNEGRHLLSVNGMTDLKGVDQISTDYEIEYVESGNGGYSNVFKWDGKVSIVDNVSIHDCYFHDTGGEGLYLGITDDSRPGQVFRNLSIYNNRLIRTGYDALQLGKVVKGANIYNNVLYGGMNWRSPFMDFQDFGSSLNFCDGGISFRNNIILGGSGALYQLGLRFQPWYSSIDPVGGDINFDNNLFVNTKSSVGAYMIADELSNKGVTHSINNNDFGGFKNFRYNQVFPNWTTVPFVIKNFSPLAPKITNNRWDSSGGKTSLYSSDYGLGTLTNNSIAAVPNPIFVNFLGISDFDYTNLDLWAPKTTVGVPGTVVVYKAGQFVLWKSKMYKCILQNSQVEPGVSSSWGTYWQLMNQPADDLRLVTSDPNFVKNRGLLPINFINPPVNQAPKSNAGVDKEITLPVNSLSLVGSGTDADGTISGYQWNKIAGPSSFSIVSPTSATTSINNLVAGEYRFELVVTDNLNAIGRDTVLVRVNSLSNQAPKSNAGVDKEITLPVNSLSLVGSGTDADGTISGYQWNKIAGPSSFSIVSPTSATTSINNLVAGEYRFELVVTDNLNAIGRDTVLVRVVDEIIKVDNQKHVKLSIFPNPASTTTNILVTNLGEIKNVRIQIISFCGKVIYSKEFFRRGSSIEIKLNVSLYMKGVYYVKVLSERKVIQKSRFLKL
jgi:hypothetical protein